MNGLTLRSLAFRRLALGSRWSWGNEDPRDHERRPFHEAPAREEQADASERPEKSEELGAAVVDLGAPDPRQRTVKVKKCLLVSLPCHK